jgi:hypothetical protein
VPVEKKRLSTNTKDKPKVYIPFFSLGAKVHENRSLSKRT